MTISCLESISSNTGWKAKLDLSFVDNKNKTAINHRKHFGPLQIQKPFYPEANGTCHVYLLHPPGGVVGGDHIDIQMEVGAKAKALVTTPAAGKFYRSAGPVACQNLNIKVASQGILEWFPSENIFFSGAKAILKTKIELTKGSHFLGWDMCCLGRPASGERFSQGSLDQRIEILVNGKPVRLERFLVKENDPILDAKWGLAEKPMVGSLLCVTPRQNLVNLLRQNIPPSEAGDLISVTFVDGVILCRYLGNSVEQAKRIFISAWKLLRVALWGQKAVIPRIWNT